jgi:cystathionine gamma-synthase
VDFVIHSATKYLGGHNDLLAGAVVGSDYMIGVLRDAQGMMGAADLIADLDQALTRL